MNVIDFHMCVGDIVRLDMKVSHFWVLYSRRVNSELHISVTFRGVRTYRKLGHWVYSHRLVQWEA